MNYKYDKEGHSLFITKKISLLLKKLIIFGVVSLLYPGISYSAGLKVSDSIYSKFEFSSDSIQIRTSNLNPSLSFYKSDSIFSFRSQKGYFPALLTDFEVQIVSPFKLSAKQWLITGAAVGISAALIHFDGDIDKWARVQKQDHKWVNKTSPVITKFGGNWGVFTVIATGLFSAVIKNEKGVQTSLLATQAMITSGVWANIVKILTGRERPNADYTFSKKAGGAWYGPFSAWDQDLVVRKPISEFDAFPSGHTATAFSIATVFATQYKDIKAVPIICYSAATLVGISRLTEHQHWGSDIFVGGLLGYLCGKQVVKNFNKNHPGQDSLLQSKSKKKSEITFIQNGNQLGFCMKWL